MKQREVSVIQHSQPQGVKPKMTTCKFRSDVYWHGVLKAKRHKRRATYTQLIRNTCKTIQEQ
jgi:hypothetical protein